MSVCERISSVLSQHPWLLAAYAAEPGALLLLSPEGHAQILRQGRQSLLDGLHAYLVAKQMTPPREWRVLDALPKLTDAAAIAQLLGTARPRAPLLLAEHERDGQWTLTVRLPLELVHFDDHFRHAPVLAGVVQVNFALALAAPRLGTSLHCREMEALKFQRLLRPGDPLELRLRFEDEPGDERGKLHFAYHLDGAHCSSGRLRVAKHT